jgi:hypothetical protein
MRLLSPSDVLLSLFLRLTVLLQYSYPLYEYSFSSTYTTVLET